jgi:hypothetical protein
MNHYDQGGSVNKEYSRKNGAEDYLTGLRKRIEQFSKESHFQWTFLKQPQVKTIPIIPVTGGGVSKGLLKHNHNKDYWKP